MFLYIAWWVRDLQDLLCVSAHPTNMWEDRRRNATLQKNSSDVERVEAASAWLLPDNAPLMHFTPPTRLCHRGLFSWSAAFLLLSSHLCAYEGTWNECALLEHRVIHMVTLRKSISFRQPVGRKGLTILLWIFKYFYILKKAVNILKSRTKNHSEPPNSWIAGLF